MSMQIKIAIADRTFSSRKGLRAILQENESLECVAAVSDIKALLLTLKESLAELLIIHYCCKVCFSVSGISEIKTRYPKLKILVISHEKSPAEIRKLIDIGIANCIFSDCSEKEIIQAVEACIKGSTSFPEQIITAVLEKDSTKDSIGDIMLTQRENEIIKLIAQGLSGKEIAEKLFLSYHTIGTHRKNIFQKLDIKSSAELILYALRVGLISLD